MSQTAYLGLDGGGTRTVALLVDESGRVVAFQRGASTNFHVVGEATAKANLFTLFEQLLNQSNLTRDNLRSICLGLSGCDRPEDKRLIGQWLEEYGVKDRALIVNDAVIALAGGTLADIGMLVISGTGSIFFARGLDGKTRRVGGWGPLLADEGSGYHLGREALRAVMRAYDGYEPPTLLSELLIDVLGLERVTDLVRWSTSEGLIKDKVAALSRQVFIAAEKGDATANAIIERLSDLVARMTGHLAAMMNLGEKYEVVLAGGNFKHNPVYFDRTKAKIEKALPQASVILPKMQPVIGAILYAMADCRHPVDASMLDNLRSTYPERT